MKPTKLTPEQRKALAEIRRDERAFLAEEKRQHQERARMAKLAKLLAPLRNPGGGTRVSHKRMGEKYFTCVRCHLPTTQQDESLPEGTATCECK